MTSQEAIEELRQIAMTEYEHMAMLDIETMHIKADDLLCNLLADAGYEDVVEEYNKLSGQSWYA